MGSGFDRLDGFAGKAFARRLAPAGTTAFFHRLFRCTRRVALICGLCMAQAGQAPALSQRQVGAVEQRQRASQSRPQMLRLSPVISWYLHNPPAWLSVW